MGEIRSTLDIIMEKTKGLTMSEEEKRAFQEEEMAGKVKGLIQKFLDGVLDMERLKMEMATLAEKDEAMLKRLVREESLSRIELGENNEPLLRVLHETTGFDPKSVRESQRAFEDRLERERVSREEGLKKKLEEQGISGSAVLPNINADPEWSRYVTEIRDEFKTRPTGSSKQQRD